MKANQTNPQTQPQKLTIALTGGVGSGKSRILELLNKEYNARTFRPTMRLNC